VLYQQALIESQTAVPGSRHLGANLVDAQTARLSTDAGMENQL